MPAISPVSSGVSAPSSDFAAASAPTRVLDQNAFMKLLAVQFQMQDPMKPLEDTAFIAQSAQFAALEQATALTSQMAELRAEQQRVIANSYLGLKVTAADADGQPVTGTVSAVALEQGEPQLVIGGQKFPLSAVLRAEPAAGAGPAAPPAAGPA